MKRPSSGSKAPTKKANPGFCTTDKTTSPPTDQPADSSVLSPRTNEAPAPRRGYCVGHAAGRRLHPAGPEILLKLFVNACPRQAATKRLTRLACGPPPPVPPQANRARPDSPWIQFVLVIFVVVRGTPAGVHRVLRKLYESLGDSAAACLQFNNIKPARMQACGHGVP